MKGLVVILPSMSTPVDSMADSGDEQTGTTKAIPEGGRISCIQYSGTGYSWHIFLFISAGTQDTKDRWNLSSHSLDPFTITLDVVEEDVE